LGHIVVYRSVALSLIGAEPVWSEEQTAPYARESDPISGEDACPLDKILANLDLAQEQLDEALKVLTQEDMERVIEDHPLGEHLAFYCWHETYHAGQTEYLRQLAGADDKVI
jgi:uncharacterized damage-inducible protein DinB